MKKFAILIMGIILISACEDDDDYNNYDDSEITELRSFNFLNTTTSGNYAMDLLYDGEELFTGLNYGFGRRPKLDWSDMNEDMVDVNLEIRNTYQFYASKDQDLYRDTSYFVFGVGIIEDSLEFIPRIVTTPVLPSVEDVNNVRFANFLTGEDTLYFTLNNVEKVMVGFGNISDQHLLNNEDIDNVLITDTDGNTVYITSEDIVHSWENIIIIALHEDQQAAIADSGQKTMIIRIIE